jgi:FlaA1/EpsC-like NDP-sugar epimerase
MPSPYWDPSELTHRATRRSESFLKNDIALKKSNLSGEIKGKRILIIGGSGSIGSAVVESLCKYHPSAVHVLDSSENKYEFS